MPWTQGDFNAYMALVRTANPHYERASKSSIHEVTGLLKLKRFQPGPAHVASIKTAWSKVPAAKRQVYQAAYDFALNLIEPKGAVPVAPQPQNAMQAARAGLRPVQAVQGAPVRNPPAPPNQAQAIAARMQASRASADRVVSKRVRQDLDGQRFEWDVRFRIRKSGTGRDQGFQVILTIAAFSGNGAEYNAHVARGGHAIPPTHAGAPLSDEVKRKWKSRIDERWMNATFVLLDASMDDLEKFPITFEFEWVTDAARASQTVYAVQTTDASQPPDGTINTMYWGVNDGGTQGAAIAHEFGHLIGNPDEYGACTFQGMNNTRGKNSIMEDETHGVAKPGHFYLIATEICAGFNYPANQAQIRMGNLRYNVASNHPWK